MENIFYFTEMLFSLSRYTNFLTEHFKILRETWKWNNYETLKKLASIINWNFLNNAKSSLNWDIKIGLVMDHQRKKTFEQDL